MAGSGGLEYPHPMKFASIDIGTNTILLLVASVSDRGEITTLHSEQRVPRLGAGVDASRTLRDDAITRALDVLVDYRNIITPFAPDRIVAFGTSAVRDASNSQHFARAVKEAAGFDLEILSGEEEALWTYRGALSGFPEVDAAVVVDIGGGSTEITTGKRHDIAQQVSLNMGSVRLTERILKHAPPHPAEIQAARSAIRQEIAASPRIRHDEHARLIGVAGTATSLALLAQEKKTFSLAAVAGYRLPIRIIHELSEQLAAMTPEEILALSDVMQGRHDIIVAGALLLEEIMEILAFDELLVSERGVRYGIVVREWEKSGTASRRP